ncbi:MAG: glycosyltransferase family protein, partial [Actinomycetota bacterium]
YLRFAEWAAARMASDELVADAQAMRSYYLETYGRDSTFISNGAHILTELPQGALQPWGVEAGAYYLVACRIEPENNIDAIVREFLASGSNRELVIAGGMNYRTPYWAHLQRLAEGGRVRFLGPVYGPTLVERLHLGCYGYIHGHEVGGTNPSLLKAMGCGNCALALDTAFNREVLEGSGLPWEKTAGSLAERIRWADAHPDEVRALGEGARERIREAYTWDLVAREHDAFFRSIAGKHGVRE